MITFNYAQSELSDSDRGTISEIATYMADNPSLQLGLDGFQNPNDRNMNERRVASVRDALIVAGVPSYKIQSGAFGDQQRRQDGRVELLLSTWSKQGNQSSMAQ